MTDARVIDALVIGAGPCGLAAAWELARNGARVRVLEARSQAGGLCATVERDGFRFDLGGHRVLTRDTALAARMHALLGDNLLRRRRRSVILWNGRAIQYPLEATDLAQTLPAAEVAAALASYVGARLRREPDDGTFATWVRRRFGQHLYARFFRPYTERLWGIPATHLSSDWARERISLVDLWDAVLRGIGVRRGDVPRTYAREYLYPRRGIGQLFEALAADLTAAGGEVILGAPVVALETGDRRVVAAVDASGRRHPCRTVVSTMPLPLLATLLDDTRSTHRHAEQLRFRAMRFVNIALRQPAFSDATWTYLAVDGAAVTRVQEPKRRSPEMAPAGHTSLMLECPCDVGDEVWSMPDDELLERSLGELATAGRPVPRDRILWAFSTRAANAYPVYSLGYDQHRQALLRQVERSAINVRTAGRQGTFRYVNMETAMLMGVEAGRQLGADVNDGARIYDLHRDHTVSELLAVTA